MPFTTSGQEMEQAVFLQPWCPQGVITKMSFFDKINDVAIVDTFKHVFQRA